MIVEKKVSVFNSGCNAMINTINCRGVMGAGLALEFKMRYPELFSQYESDCRKGLVRIGEVRKYNIDGIIVLNFPTKDDWKYPSRLSYIEKGLNYFRDHYKEWNVSSVAMPPLGCNNGQLDIGTVKQLIYEKLDNVDIEIVFCEDPGYPEGKEKEMLDDLKSTDLDALCRKLRLNKNVKNSLNEYIPKTDRFYKIALLDGIGEKTYEKLFHYFYEKGDSVEQKRANIKSLTDFV